MIKTNYAEIEKVNETKFLVILWQVTGDCKMNIIKSIQFAKLEDAAAHAWEHTKTFNRISFKKLGK